MGPGRSEELTSVCKNCRESAWTLCFMAKDFDTSTEPHWLAKCSSCGIIATLDVDDNTLASAYSSTYYGSGRFKFSGLLERLLKLVTRRNARLILAKWATGRKHAGQPKVMDIGCGRGLLLREFRSLGALVHGLERSQFPLEPMSDEYIRIGSIQDPEYDGSKFDIIVVWHVLEHIGEVDAILAAISHHLEPHGLLVIAVPNYGSFQRRLFGKHWFHLDIPRHLNHFDRGWLTARLQANNLDRITISTFDLVQNTYGFIQSAFNRLFPDRPNQFYNLLKHGVNAGQLAMLIPWLGMMVLVLPLAIIELIYSALTGQGATLIIHARSGSSNVER